MKRLACAGGTPAVNRRTLLKALAGSSMLCPTVQVHANNGTLAAPAGAAVWKVAEQYFDDLLNLDPLWASELGLATPRQAAELAIEIGDDHRRQAGAVHLRTLEAVRSVEPDELDHESTVLLQTVRWIAEDQLSRLQFPDHLMPLDQQGFSVPFRLASALQNGLSPFKSADDFERHLQRLRLLPTWCEQAVANARQGVRDGIVQPAPVLKRLLPLLVGLAAPGNKSPFLTPLSQLKDSTWPGDHDRFRSRYARVVDKEVVPAMRLLAHTVQSLLLPNARSSSAWASLPQGARWYSQWVRSHTSTNLDAEQIHSLGLREVAVVSAQLDELLSRIGIRGGVGAIGREYASLPASRPFKTELAVLERYRHIQRRVNDALPAMFNRLPRAALEIWPEPELTKVTAGEHYAAPSADGSRPGVFFAPVPDPARYSARGMTTLFLHEGMPGHHLQMALAQELPLSRLQKHYLHTAYGEGWAVYAETLGHSFGLYDDTEAYLGHLLMAAVRAVRLVVDTGIHAMGWSYEKAVSYFSEKTGYEERAAQLQIERYMAQPGQALAYAVGRMSIETLRESERLTKGPRFSLPEFHAAVLQRGALPLSVLEQAIGRIPLKR